jgi:alpha-methylacyl-CoA racemase
MIRRMSGPKLPLIGTRVVNAGVNLPGVAASARFCQLGATVTKVEPPAGDPMEAIAPALYAELVEGHDVVRLDLKGVDGRQQLDGLLHQADVFLTSTRPSALKRLGLAPEVLSQSHPRLIQIAIVGHADPDQELAGHDLTYVASEGLLSDRLPTTLVADLGGAERTVSTALALLLARDRDPDTPLYAEVALAESAAYFAIPARHGITAAGGPLGGADPFYAVYDAAEGRVALAALEPHFQKRLLSALAVEATAEGLAKAFAARSATEWEAWAHERDIPLAAVLEANSVARAIRTT